MSGLDLLARIQPHNLDAERAALGCFLLEPGCVHLLDGVRPEIFYTEGHRIIVRAMQALARAGQPVDALTLADQLRGAGHLELVGGVPAIALLQEQASIASHVESYLGIVQRCGVRRELIALSARTMLAAYDDASPDPAELIAATHARLLELDAVGSDLVLLGDAIVADVDDGEPVPTGVAAFDDPADGLTPGHLTILAGRPGAGKTALACQVALHIARRLRLPLLFLSLEMPPREIGARMLSHETGIATRHILRNTAADARQLDEARTALGAAPIFVQRAYSRLLPDVLGAIRVAVVKHHVRAVILDHLGRVAPARRTSRYEDATVTAEELKAAALQLRVPVLALAQLNRAVESRDSAKPMLSDLRDSGRLEEEADEILFIYPSPPDQPDGCDPLSVGLYLAKDRNGPVGERLYNFEKSRGRFTEQSRREELTGRRYCATGPSRTGGVR